MAEARPFSLPTSHAASVAIRSGEPDCASLSSSSPQFGPPGRRPGDGPELTVHEAERPAAQRHGV